MGGQGMGKKCLAIIPARGGSKRIPGKNIMSLSGTPLVAISIEHALRSKSVDRVVVSTEDAAIAALSKKHGAEVVKRPKRLAGDKATSESALLHVLDELEKREGYVPDIVVFLQCTSPLRENSDIDNAIKKFYDVSADSLLSVVKFDKYIWQLKAGKVSPLNYDYRKRWREQDFPPQYQENGSIYIFKPRILRALNNRLGGKIAIYEMDSRSFVQIDSQLDIEMFKCLRKTFGKIASLENR